MKIQRMIMYVFITILLPVCAIELFQRLDLIDLLWMFDDNKKVEGVSEGGFDLRDIEPYLMFQSTASSDVRVKTGQQKTDGELTHIKTNSLGFRYDEEIPTQKEPNEIRIFMLGGSVVFNGLKNETTIAGMLEARLKDRLAGKKVRCINTGIISANSDQELVLLVQKVIDLKPDIVVVLDGFNDLNIPYNYEPRLGYPFNWVTIENARAQGAVIRRAIGEMGAVDYLLAMSRIATRINPNWSLENQIIQAAYTETEKQSARPDIAAIIGHLLTNWQKMHAIANAVGGKMLAILQPMNPSVRDRAHYKPFYDTANTHIERLRWEHDLPFYSFDRLLDEYPREFHDVAHTWDESHAIFAAKIEDLLVEVGYIPE